MTTVLIVLPYHSRNDAVANDARMQAAALRRAGIEAVLYADLHDPDVASELVPRTEFDRLIREPSTVLLYHMCVFWDRLESVLAEARCKVVVKYHNITPPEFFESFDPQSAHATREGLRQAARVLTSARLDLILATSRFTLDEIHRTCGTPKAKTVIQAPFVPTNDFDACSEAPETARFLADGRAHFLFVGRFVPHKGHRHLVGVANSYRELYGENFCLTAAGKIAPNCRRYHDEIQTLARELGLERHVRILDGVPFRDLYTYFKRSTATLILSEHEGFCVPVIEAQYLGCPVLALERAAVTETVGKGQLTASDANYDFFAAAAHAVATDAPLRQTLVERGRANAARYSEQSLGAEITRTVQDLAVGGSAG